MKSLFVRGLAAAICVMTCSQKADAIMIEYIVEFAQTGDVALGSTLDWTLSYQISDSTPGNFGVRTAAVDLFNSTGEAMPTGDIELPFAFATNNGGTEVAGGLLDIGYSLVNYNDLLIAGEDGNLGPHVFATGSYVVNTLGLHTLMVDPAMSDSFYFTAEADDMFALYDAVITTSSDSVNVVGEIVPEPSSMLLGSTLLFPGLIAVRRRRKQRLAEQVS